MATEVVQDNTVGDDTPQISNDSVATAAAEKEEELKLLQDSVQALPAAAVKDLFSIGACARCIFRFFGLSHNLSSFPSLPTSTIIAMLVENVMGEDRDDNCNGSRECKDSNSQQLSSQPFVWEPTVCRICLGILNFLYHDEKGTLVKKDSAYEFAKVIAESVKKEHPQIDSFSLEVSLLPVIMDNEQVVRSYMRKKYGSEHWLLQKNEADCIPVKDALKSSILDTLEKLLGTKSNLSTFRIRLTYENTEESRRKLGNEEINGCKRRKTEGFAKDLEGHGNDYLEFQLEKESQPFRLVFLGYRCPIYIGGRYLKYSRNVSQTCWMIEDERMGEASVEEIIGGSILPLCQGDGYKFHAAGREDIDVRMLGTGRPFLVEIQNARQVPSEQLIKDMEMKINCLENKLVGIKNLKILDNNGWALMREGEADKQKQYAALVWISRQLNDDDLKTLSSLQEMQILQKTPIRVLHRRSPLEREKVIHWMKVEKIAGSCQYFLLHLCTQAGTYIKEFVHGDLGRTHPSIGSILGCRAEILQLDVTDVKMDCF